MLLTSLNIYNCVFAFRSADQRPWPISRSFLFLTFQTHQLTNTKSEKYVFFILYSFLSFRHFFFNF